MIKANRGLLLATLLATGCAPGPRADRVFLPPAEYARRTQERLRDLQD